MKEVNIREFSRNIYKYIKAREPIIIKKRDKIVCQLNFNVASISEKSEKQKSNQKKRTIVLLTKEKKCLICGETRKVEKCHLPSKRFLDDYLTREYIIYLCPTHHKLLDRGGLTEKEKEKLYPICQKIDLYLTLEAIVDTKRYIKSLRKKIKDLQEILEEHNDDLRRCREVLKSIYEGTRDKKYPHSKLLADINWRMVEILRNKK